MIGSVLLAALALNFSIKTSIYDMVGMEDVASMSEIRAGTDDKVIVVCDTLSPELSRKSVREFIESLPPEYLADSDLASLAKLDVIADKVCDEDAELLQTPDGRAKIAKRAIRRYVASPMPPLFKPDDDPFCLKERYLLSFVSDRVAIMPFSLLASVVGDIDRLIEVVADIRGRIAAENRAHRDLQPFVMSVTGVPVHTAVTAGECKRQIGWLTWFSLLFIALLSLFVFKSVKWIPLLALSLLVSCLAGATAIFVFFDSVHIMALVFGTTVLGLVIDYSFHWLLASEHGPALRRNLIVSWMTTEISLLPLLLSSLPVLRQTALFLAVALAAALAFVIFAYPRRARIVLALAFSTLAFVFSGCDQVRTDPKSLYHAPAELASADRVVALRWGTGDGAADLIAKLYAEQGANVSSALGLPELKYVPPSGVERPQRLLEDLLDRLTRETMSRLLAALGLMFVVLVFFFRKRALRAFLPSALALAGIFGLVLVVNGQVNLFHLLAMFLLAGMSIDYTVFLHNGGKEALKPAACSLFTSMAGFGALSFVSFPVVSAFGFVLGIGLPLAFGIALGLIPRGCETDAPEKAASPLGMELLYAVYRVFGLSVLRFGAAFVGVVVWCCSKNVRKASPRIRKMVNFTRSLADKLVVMAEGKSLPKVVTDGSEDAKAFLDDVFNRRGVFVMSSHVGTIEVLAALGECEATFHAWMEFERTGVFNRFYLRHARRQKVVIHPISEFGMQTVFEAGDLIDSGDCLLMAGDRGDGAFRFAAAFDHPVYFVACVAEGNGYRAVIRRLPAKAKEIRTCYFEILEELKRNYQDQWFEWNR